MKRVTEKESHKFRQYLSASPSKTVTTVCINSGVNLIQIVSFIEANIVKVMSWRRADLLRFKLNLFFFLVLSDPEEDETRHSRNGDNEEGAQEVGSGCGVVSTDFPHGYCNRPVLLLVGQEVWIVETVSLIFCWNDQN